MELLRPVVALDVDGVLRALAIHKDPAERARVLSPHSVTLRKDEYPFLFHGAPEWDEEGLSHGEWHLSRAAVEWVQRLILSDAVDVVWATTWERYANTYVAPLLGIPPLEVGVRADEGSVDYRSTSHGWKAEQLGRRYPGRPLLWVDDGQPMGLYESIALQRDEEDRPISAHLWIDGKLGMQPRHVALGDEWLAQAMAGVPTLPLTPTGALIA